MLHKYISIKVTVFYIFLTLLYLVLRFWSGVYLHTLIYTYALTAEWAGAIEYNDCISGWLSNTGVFKSRSP